jgi:16S rRNA (guanine966-N2)-methyltransferase
LYSGSGALGFECLSRGAEEINFVEKNSVIYRTLEENIKLLKVEDKSKIFVFISQFEEKNLQSP